MSRLQAVVGLLLLPCVRQSYAVMLHGLRKAHLNLIVDIRPSVRQLVRLALTKPELRQSAGSNFCILFSSTCGTRPRELHLTLVQGLPRSCACRPRLSLRWPKPRLPAALAIDLSRDLVEFARKSCKRCGGGPAGRHTA